MRNLHDRPTNIVQMPADFNAIRSALTNEQAEAAVLGAVLREPETYASVSEIVEDAEFSLVFNGYVWKAFERITERGADIDLLTVADELDAQKQLAPDALDRLSDYMSNAPRAHSAEVYAAIIHDNAMRLRVCQAAERMKQVAMDKKTYRLSESMVDECNRLLFEATDQNAREADTHMRDIVGEYYETVERAMVTGERRGIQTGLSNLDDLLRGAVPGELTVVAGAEGMGKTTFMMSVARSMARRGYGLAIFTLEMSREEIARILIGMESGIAKRALKALDLTDRQWQQFVDASGVVGNWDLHVIDEFPQLTPIQLRRRLRTLIDAQKQRIDAVIIDGLWLMEPTDRVPERHTAVGNITRDLITVARDFHVPIYITHQYNGKAHERNDKRPKMHDLAESAGVRRNAQVILGMYRDSYYGTNEDDDDGVTELHCMKDRNGSGAQGRLIKFFFEYSKGLFLPAADIDPNRLGYGDD